MKRASDGAQPRGPSWPGVDRRRETAPSDGGDMSAVRTVPEGQRCALTRAEALELMSTSRVVVAALFIRLLASACTPKVIEVE